MKNSNMDISFLDKLERLYFEMAFTELAMDYYCLKEKDSDDCKRENGTEFRERIEKLIENCIYDYDRIPEIGAEAENLRNELKLRVGCYINKIDRLELNRYVEERKERETELFAYPNDDEAAKDILRSIFAENDNNLINERIKNAVYELPLRMTKVRFFDILKDGLNKYIGAEEDILERMIYLIESASGISGDNIGSDVFENPDDETIYSEYEYLDELTGICNYICVLVKAGDELIIAEKSNIGHMLELIKVSSTLDESTVSDAELILTKLEGKLEELSESIAFYEAKLSGYIESTDEPVEKALKLEIMRRLLSPSKYAELELITGKESKAVDEETVDKEYKKLTDKLSAAFDSGDRNLNRARMASVLSMLPVFFNSRKEVMDYVRNSLASCNNIHEKNVAISNILKQGF